jgi:translation initiation factor 3 subunit B
MAPGFDQLSDHDYDDDLENIDFSDLKERYDVRMEEGLDTFVVRMLGTTAHGRDVLT